MKDIKSGTLHTFEKDSWEDGSSLDSYFEDHEVEFQSGQKIIKPGNETVFKAFNVRALTDTDHIIKGKVQFSMKSGCLVNSYDAQF